MTKCEFQIYDKDLEIIGRGLADDRHGAEIESALMADRYRAIGHNVRAIEYVDIELRSVYSEAEDMTIILREYRDNYELFSKEILGAYSGKPDDEVTKAGIGQLSVEY